LVLDEADAVLHVRKPSGSTTGGATEESNAMIMQFLQEMDGPTAAPNVMVVGTTNNPDRLDPAVLRRFTVVLEVPPPSLEGREAILRIHTAPLATRGALAAGVNLRALAGATEGFTGAMLEELVHAARNAAVARYVDIDSLDVPVSLWSMQVRMVDFEAAVPSVRAAQTAAHEAAKESEAAESAARQLTLTVKHAGTAQ
jgi:transitional endoplasmic reticulum ATPase